MECVSFTWAMFNSYAVPELSLLPPEHADNIEIHIAIKLLRNKRYLLIGVRLLILFSVYPMIINSPSVSPINGLSS